MTDNFDPYAGLTNPTPNGNEAVRLPFPALYLAWSNGAPNQKQLGGVFYHGGWTGKADQLAQYPDLQLPKSFGTFLQTSRDGKTWDAFGARFITAAIVASRQRFYDYNDPTQVSLTWRQGYTNHIQWLAALFVDGSLGKFVPVVLTTKGMQAKHMNDALKAWREAFTAADAKLNKYPISAFALSLGSYGEEPTFERVGKAPKQSTITPIKPVIVGDIAKRLVPADTAMALVDLRTKAADWLMAWAAQAGQAPLPVSNAAPAVAEDIPF